MASGTKTTTHTPGPWRMELDRNEQWNVYGRDGDEWIALVPHQCVAAIEAQQAINARLIAAAPELLAALKRGHRKLLTYGQAYPGDKELHKTLIPMWEAAIAKAEGL